MKISIASDHGGLVLKGKIVDYLLSENYQVTDFGTNSMDSCDYPDFGFQAAEAVANGIADRGIVICTTGIGMCIVANKVEGIRCALVDSVPFAKLTREHNDSNVLALGANAVSISLAKEIIDTWLKTPFSNNERHQRRIDKITNYEKEKEKCQ